MILLVHCAWEAAVAVVSRLWGERRGGGGDSSRRRLLETFLASSPQTRDPSALWLLPAHSCVDAFASLVWGSEKVQEPHLPTHHHPQGPRKKITRFL